MILSFSQLRAEWLTAGGAPKDADTMAAIAMAESHGRLGDHNADDPYGGSWCAWQINGVHPFLPRELTHDPYYCALGAVYVKHKQGLNAWSTHRYGQYRAFMPHQHAARAHAHRQHQRFAVVAHKNHGHPRHALHHDTGTQAALNNVAISFALAAGVLLAWNVFRAGCRLVESSIREEVAARRRYARRKRYQDEAAFRKRTMPRTQRRAALAANAC